MSFKKQSTNQKVDSEAVGVDTDKKPGTGLPPKLTSKKILIIVVVLIVVVVGVIAATKSSKDQGPSNKPEATLNDVRAQSENKTSANQFDEALAVWEEFLKSSERSEEEKIYAHFGMALVYTNKGDHKSALEQYRKAERISTRPRADIVGGILSAAIETGDKAVEREYLRKTIELLDPKNPLYEADKAAYEARLKELDAQSD